MAPLIAPVNGRRTSGYGPRNTGIPGATTYHRGVDIGANPIGSKPPVLAPQAGRILSVHRTVTNARGKYVILRGADADYLVQHLDKIPLGIIKGRKVKIGKKLGTMGNTSTLAVGIHLHFEVHAHPANGTNTVAQILAGTRAVDPEKFYPAHGQPRPWERPGEGEVFRPKFRNRHLRLAVYKPNRKKVHKLRKASWRFTSVLSTWAGWTILRNGTFVRTARITKEK